LLTFAIKTSLFTANAVEFQQSLAVQEIPSSLNIYRAMLTSDMFMCYPGSTQWHFQQWMWCEGVYMWMCDLFALNSH